MALNPSPTNGPSDGHLKLMNLLNIFHPPPIDSYPMLSRSFHPSCKYDYIGVNSSLKAAPVHPPTFVEYQKNEERLALNNEISK